MGLEVASAVASDHICGREQRAAVFTNARDVLEAQWPHRGEVTLNRRQDWGSLDAQSQVANDRCLGYTEVMVAALRLLWECDVA